MTQEITINDLTTGLLEGNGVFDKLMAATKGHLDAELKKGSIRGPEYSQVYLGQVQAVLQLSLAFLTAKSKIALEAELLAQQVELTKAQVALAQQQVLNAIAEQAKTAAETLNIPKQGLMLDAQVALAVQQKLNSVEELALISANKSKVIAETANVPKQGALIEAQTAMSIQQKANAVLEGKVLVAQECKLRAEFDLTMNTNIKTTSEIALLAQKTTTERAQTQAIGVDDYSVIGKQIKLYQAQTDGFTRDSEQKAAKLMIDTWNARRMTDDGTVNNMENMLHDSVIGDFVKKLKAGVGA